MIGRVNVGGGGEVGPTYTIKKWCATVGYDYANLDDIPETAMRQLMTKYASVAYFLEWYSADNSMIDAFIANQYAMKWIGHRDYICDKLLAITDFKTKALASEYWEYILKDHVPIMTSDTSPYGSVTCSENQTEYEAYRAFANDVRGWVPNVSTSSSYIQYNFTNPINVKKMKLFFGNGRGSITFSAKVYGINGSETPALVATINSTTISSLDAVLNINTTNDGYYMSYKVAFDGVLDAGSTGFYSIRLQFFGRSLNVSESTQPQNKPYMLLNGTYYTVDYSERTDRTYLYEHGVELVPFDAYSASTSNRAEKQSDRLYIDSTGATANLVEIYNTSPVNFTGKNLLRAICDDELYRSEGTVFGAIMITNSPSYHVSNGYISYVELVDSIIPNYVSLDISEVSGDKYIAFEHRSGNNKVKSTLNEIWIE